MGRIKWDLWVSAAQAAWTWLDDCYGVFAIKMNEDKTAAVEKLRSDTATMVMGWKDGRFLYSDDDGRPLFDGLRPVWCELMTASEFWPAGWSHVFEDEPWAPDDNWEHFGLLVERMGLLGLPLSFASCVREDVEPGEDGRGWIAFVGKPKLHHGCAPVFIDQSIRAARGYGTDREMKMAAMKAAVSAMSSNNGTGDGCAW